MIITKEVKNTIIRWFFKSFSLVSVEIYLKIIYLFKKSFINAVLSIIITVNRGNFTHFVVFFCTFLPKVSGATSQ